MKKVITYGTYDLLHYGHIKLLERAKALGDYLIVGVTADDFDMERGKINVQQSLTERVEAIRATGLADEIIVEEYEGQKIDDILRLNVNIFAIGSDWKGYFDYLSEYCEVKYLPRTEGVSSSEIREKKGHLKLGLVGGSNILEKYFNECKYVNGITVAGVYSNYPDTIKFAKENNVKLFDSYLELLNEVDAIYILESPDKQYDKIKVAIENSVNVLCESPIAIDEAKTKELIELAKNKQVVLMDAIKTAYSMAYNRLTLLVKSGKIGKIVSIDDTSTSLHDLQTMNYSDFLSSWNSTMFWLPTALLPIFQLLGTNYRDISIVSKYIDPNETFDGFTKVDLIYDHSVASVKIGKAVKSEGELVITGTEGYIYVPAPWWKTDYFEVRYEDSSLNKRYFYQLEGEGIRYELVAFIQEITKKRTYKYIDDDVSIAISKVVELSLNKKNLIKI